MTVRKIDPSGDISTSGIQFINGKDEVAQTISTRLRLFRGEYFRNINDGTPWFQEILGKNGTVNNIDAIIRKIITETDGVQTIIDFNADFDINTRKYKINGSVLTQYGTTEFNSG